MKSHLLTFIYCLLSIGTAAQSVTKTVPVIYIDNNGDMRRTDTREEVSFFGVNYTLPFAHAYRAIGYKGLDHKAAIDKDVYHFARLGLNAYRIHLWDVELTDGAGNLQENEHLDLMDYLIAKLKERDIRIVITAQTNFGNGYPERNQPTGGFSYQYDKCDIHSNPTAIAAQKRYLSDLIKHKNPYTGLAYKDDPNIIGFEINNEPCHSGTPEEVRTYITSMLKAMKQAGNRKPVFYNVSHNEQVVEAYFDTDVQGTTYQWYPTGLVAGHLRKGNFLPSVDSYPIPFSHVKGFNRKARLIYEFDAADILYSYIYPAMARTLRTAGFQWMTQFAYDPIDIAYANTEYQTHFLNLAYTPQKAISLKIAAEAAKELKRGASYGSYPQDTIFGEGFRVSYKEDLSELNDKNHFYYSNHTGTLPKAPEALTSIAGYGNSPIVRYEGKGAYFIDKLEPGTWRLEVMPDAIVINDPFAKPSLQKEVVTIAYGAWDMIVRLPDLGKSFVLSPLNQGNSREQEDIADGTIRSLQPGVYLLQRKDVHPAHLWKAETLWNHIRLEEFVAPAPSNHNFTVTHTPATMAETGKPLNITAEIAGPEFPDSVIIYTDKISFWNEHNPYLTMKRVSNYIYQAEVPVTEVKEGLFRYNIVVCHKGKYRTFPAEEYPAGKSSGFNGHPLDWDYTAERYWETQIVNPKSYIRLVDIADKSRLIETYTLPEWSTVECQTIDSSNIEKPLLCIRFYPKNNNTSCFLRTSIKETVVARASKIKDCTYLCIRTNRNRTLPEGLHTGFITTDGYTYSAACPSPDSEGILRISLKEFKQSDTALLPIAYPTFLPHYFHPTTEPPFRIENIEMWELSFPYQEAEVRNKEIEIGNVWLE